jgi:hypothetical protein
VSTEALSIEDTELGLVLMGGVFAVVALVSRHDGDDFGLEAKCLCSVPQRHVGTLERVREEVDVRACVSVAVGEIHRQDTAWISVSIVVIGDVNEMYLPRRKKPGFLRAS